MGRGQTEFPLPQCFLTALSQILIQADSQAFLTSSSMYCARRVCTVSIRQNLYNFSIAQRLQGKVWVSRTPLRASSSASGQVCYSPEEISDLNASLKRALRTASRSTEIVAFDRALAELNKTPFAPKDWWQATYEQSMKPVPLDRHWQVSVQMLFELYFGRWHFFQAKWSSVTVVDMKTKLKSSCYRSMMLFLQNRKS